ncbi:MAG: dihydroneopterin aldolase [Paracoccaceae bacterium]
MSNETRVAFDDLETRAIALAKSAALDRISLRNYTVDVEIGAFQSERDTTQKVRFNVVVEVRTNVAPLGDDVDRILSYDTITDAISQSLAEERLNLLETLADRVAKKILHNALAERVFVRVEKLDRGPGALGVEIVRDRDAADATGGQIIEEIQPVVIYLSNEAIEAPLLGGWIDQIENREVPVVLCVGAVNAMLPQSGDTATQRRIDLLAIEQNAWVLSGKDKRCVVTDSRTELDWAVQNKQISIWAPSKIVMDSTDNTAPIISDPLALTVWFCKQIGANSLILLGSDQITDTELQISNIPVGQAALF